MTSPTRKTAAVVVTYYPSMDMMGNIDSIADCVDHVIVVDNTPIEKSIFKKLSSVNITCRFNIANLGLAKALNDGIQLAGEMGYEDCFLFDQDSKPDASFFRSMQHFKDETEMRTANCAFCVPDFFDRNSRSRARFPLLSQYSFRHVRSPDLQVLYPRKAIVAITSGTLISCMRFQQIGPFAEDYFIDFLDNEYCLRAARMGLAVAVNRDAVLNHAIGTRLRKRLLGIHFKPNNHPPVRRYYIARNSIRTALDYFIPFRPYLALVVSMLIHEWLSILLFEKGKLVKSRALLSGITDGIRGNMGPCPHVAFNVPGIDVR